ncbi:MAG: Zn-dependent hydrolase [Thermomicrobiales bacterium]
MHEHMNVEAAERRAAITMQRFEELATISDEPDWLTRAYGRPALRHAQILVSEWMRAAGMTVSYDAVGNLCGRLEPQIGSGTVVFGGHLDTVRNAGKYDGTLGVLSGLAVAELAVEEAWELPFALEVVAFADEESYRFPTMYLGSGVWTGHFDTNLLGALDAHGMTLESAIHEFGGHPEALLSLPEPRRDVIAFVELHIEQGPVLESADAAIGIVSAIAGASQFSIDVLGMAGHAGTVPMAMRRDALVAAAECVVAIRQIGVDTDGLVATVGSLDVTPNAKNVIPGSVTFTIDIRHFLDDVRVLAVEKILLAIAGAAEQSGVAIEVHPIPGGHSTPMDTGLIHELTEILQSQGIEPRLLASGAGHDAVSVSAIAPVAMLFLRCEGGISHNPAESITKADTAVGIRVLAQLITRLATRGRANPT